MTSWREYCIKCDDLGEFYFPGNPIPEPRMHACGRMYVLISGVAVKTMEDAALAQKLRAKK